MTVSTTTSRVTYAGNGSSTNFTVPFYFLADSDLVVIKTAADGTQTTLVLNTDYTVSGAGVIAGGSITLVSAPATGYTVVIYRDPAVTQTTDYQPNDPFPAETHERALDKLTMITQRLKDLVSRSFRLSDGDTSTASTTLPSPSSNKLIAWNAAANGLQNVDPLTIATQVTTGTAKADIFSGTGSQTVFTLSANPGAINNLDVSISGVSQRPGVDFYWTSGTAITFASAPPSGTNNILARYWLGLPQGTSDSASALFIQSGTGALQRVAQDKLREFVSVKDFGADPTGAADSTTAVQNALTASRVVYFPAGIYKITSTLLIPANTLVYGAGLNTTTIQISADVVGMRAVGFYVSLRDFAVTKSGSHTNNGIEVGDASSSNGGRFSICNVSVTGVGNDGLRIRQGNLGHISDCSFISNGRDGIHFGIETIDTNAWTIDGYVSCQSNVRDGIHFEQGSSQNDAHASRSHVVSSVACQTNGRHNLYCGTPKNIIQGYFEAGVTSDIYLDTYAYGNLVIPTEATVVTDVGAGTSFNMIQTQNGGANKWRQWSSKTMFAGGTGLGMRLSNTDGTAGVLDIEKTASVTYTFNASGSGQDQNIRFVNTQGGGTYYLHLNTGIVYPVTDNALSLGTSSRRWTTTYTGTVLLSQIPAAAPAGQMSMGARFSGSASAGAATLPSNPVGFFFVNIGGTDYKVPYYNV